MIVAIRIQRAKLRKVKRVSPCMITPFTAVTVTVSKGKAGQGGRGGRKQAGGLWYVRNAAKANRKPHTPVSNEINASSFSGARGQIRRRSSINR